MRPVHPAPSPEPLRLGARLRASRTAQGLTLGQLAAATGLSKGFISRVERDETSPSVTSLATLCQVLSLPVGSLFVSPDHEVITLQHAPLINMGGVGALERLITPRHESGVQLLRSQLDGYADGGKELYTINCEVESVHVLSGRLTLRFTSQEATLEQGDTLTFAGREPHSWHNPSTQPAEVLWVLVPAAWSGSA
ncbi:MAG TPA: helix-turn-helix domain-containing protein [Marmoricola sp.]|nr:helix-turn-helix domain-containing protein [Marmoricola sp.]